MFRQQWESKRCWFLRKLDADPGGMLPPKRKAQKNPELEPPVSGFTSRTQSDTKTAKTNECFISGHEPYYFHVEPLQASRTSDHTCQGIRTVYHYQVPIFVKEYKVITGNILGKRRINRVRSTARVQVHCTCYQYNEVGHASQRVGCSREREVCDGRRYSYSLMWTTCNYIVPATHSEHM